MTLKDINLVSLQKPNFLNPDEENSWTAALDSLIEVRDFLSKVEIGYSTSKIPLNFKNNFEEIKKDFIEHYDKFSSEKKGGSTSEKVQYLINEINRTIDYKNQFFMPNTSNHALFVCLAILSFSETNQDQLLNETNALKHDLKSEINRVKLVSKELEEKSAQFVVSNYAKIFENQEALNKGNANTWMVISIGFSLLSLVLIFLSFKYDWFNITTITAVKEDNQIFNKQVYNYPNLITKVFIISILIYLISFFFKQYSVNRHLQALNNHRKNALNSYILFAESIGDKDISAKTSLMLQVSKSIL